MRLQEIIYGLRQSGKTTHVIERLLKQKNSYYIVWNKDHWSTLVLKYPELKGRIGTIDLLLTYQSEHDNCGEGTHWYFDSIGIWLSVHPNSLTGAASHIIVDQEDTHEQYRRCDEVVFTQIVNPKLKLVGTVKELAFKIYNMSYCSTFTRSIDYKALQSVEEQLIRIQKTDTKIGSVDYVGAQYGTRYYSHMDLPELLRQLNINTSTDDYTITVGADGYCINNLTANSMCAGNGRPGMIPEVNLSKRSVEVQVI